MRSLRKGFMAIMVALTVIVGTMGNGLVVNAAVTYKTVTGGANAASIDKYFVVDGKTDMPPATFTFSIASGTAVAVTSTTPEIKAGPAGAKLTYNGSSSESVSITFNSSSTTYDSVQTGDRIDLPANHKYAADTFTVDLSGVTFNELGIYRYVITETGTNAGVTNDTITSRYVDVYVTANEDDPEQLEIPEGGVIVHPGDDVPGSDGAKPAGMPSNSDPVGDEEDGDAGEGGTVKPSDITTWQPKGGNDSFVNVYAQASNNITISSVTDGNQGDKNKNFVYILTITNPTNIFVDGSVAVTWENNDAEVTVSGEVTSPTVYTATITMPSGKSVVLNNIPSGATVKSEVFADSSNATVESIGYAAKYSLDSATAIEGTSLTASVNQADHTIAWTLTKGVKIPTGIYIRVLPFVLLALFAVAVLAIKAMRKHVK